MSDGRFVPDVDIDVDRYLRRIDVVDRPSVDLEGLAHLQLAHLRTVAFENLDVYAGVPVRTDLAWSIPKVVDRRRGGWCFEVNGAFAGLLAAMGFEVRLLGAAVLLGGPTTVVDHLTLEVQLDEPFLVDVGFGDSFTRPLRLNVAGPQDGGNGTYELLASPQGTTLTREEHGVPAAQYRFKRVSHRLADFEPASEKLRSDLDGRWRTRRFATRLINDELDRVTLLTDRLKTVRHDGTSEESPVAATEWDAVLLDRFAMTPPSTIPN